MLCRVAVGLACGRATLWLVVPCESTVLYSFLLLFSSITSRRKKEFDIDS